MSPDNADCFFYPQGVATRPAFIHALASSLGDVSVMTHDSYAPPGGNYYIMALDNALNLSQYNVISGAIATLGTISPWAGKSSQRYMSGVQLFDKFFMAFFDTESNLNQISCAADLPRYVNQLGSMYRLTVDAPGGGFSVSSHNLSTLLQYPAAPTELHLSCERSNNIVTATLNTQGYFSLEPNPFPQPGWFIQMFDIEATVPEFNQVDSFNQTGSGSGLNSSVVQSATPGGNTAGNIVWVYYNRTTGDSDVIDTNLYNAWVAAQAGGYTLYVKIENSPWGPAGVFPVVMVGSQDMYAQAWAPNGRDSHNWFYFGYQIPGPPTWGGAVSNTPPDTTATFAYSTASVTPNGDNNVNGNFTGNELYQEIDGGSTSIISDGSGTVKFITESAITNLPVGAWLYVVMPANSDIPFTSGWVQVGSVINNTTFTVQVPQAQIFSMTGALLYEYWGSLNSNVNLQQPIPGQSVSNTDAQSGAQGFQILSCTQLNANELQMTWYQLGPDSVSGADAGHFQVVLQSQSAPGNRQAFCFFIMEDGWASPGSPPINFTTLGGPNFSKFNLPLGPPGTVARGVAITGANGSQFFFLPPNNTPSSAGPIVTSGTLVNDNSTTVGESASGVTTWLDWSDAALIAAIPVSGAEALGSDYGDLTSLINLPPVLGMIPYETSIAVWGQWNAITNLLNMSMQGGSASVTGNPLAPTGVPLGWDDMTAHGNITPDQEGTLALASDGSGWEYQMPNASTGTNYNCMISQSAYQDIWGAPILEPNQQYMLVCRAAVTGSTLNEGSIIVVLESDLDLDTTVDIFAEAKISAASLSETLSWIAVPFVIPGGSTIATMPAAIPQDARIMTYRNGAYANTLHIADAFLVNYNNPILTNQVRLSYPENPWAYDDENGYVLIAPTAEPIVSAFVQREKLGLNTTKDLLLTQSNNEVPSEWDLALYGQNCGGSGPNGVDSQDDVAWWIGRNGVQVYSGSKTKKISQEINPDLEAINWDYLTGATLAEDSIQRVLYMAVPTDSSTLNNQMFTMNHRMTDPDVNVLDPIHISSYTGKMIATDLARKWSPWNIPCNCVSVAYANYATDTYGDDNALNQRMMFSLGQRSSGYDLFGQIYMQDFYNYPPGNPNAEAWTSQDEDYGGIDAFYFTYFFFSHDIEQNAMLALYRKLFAYMSFHCTGIGNLLITPYVDALNQPWGAVPSWPLALDDPGIDYDLALNVTGNRMSLNFSAPGGAFWLTHLIVSARRDLVFPVRGAL